MPHHPFELPFFSVVYPQKAVSRKPFLPLSEDWGRYAPVMAADPAIPDIQVIVPRRRIQFRKLVDGVEVPSGRLPVLLLATRVAEGRRVLDVMAVSTLPSKMKPK